MRVKVISDGTALGTKVFNMDTGLQITNVIGVTFHASMSKVLGTITLRTDMVEIQSNMGIKE